MKKFLTLCKKNKLATAVTSICLVLVVALASVMVYFIKNPLLIYTTFEDYVTTGWANGDDGAVLYTADDARSVKVAGWNEASYGIDVSKHNGRIDWEKVAAEGIDFVMIRCGYRGCVSGEIVKDIQFDNNIKGAAENGIPIGVYFYSTAVTPEEAEEEAAFVCSEIRKHEKNGIKITYPIAYDFEEFYNDEYTRAGGLTREQLTENTVAFLDIIDGAGYIPMLYASKSAVSAYWDFGPISGYDFWLAHYTANTSFDGSFMMWQYTCKGRVDGIYNYVDFNVARYVVNDDYV